MQVPTDIVSFNRNVYACKSSYKSKPNLGPLLTSQKLRDSLFWTANMIKLYLYVNMFKSYLLAPTEILFTEA